MDQIICIKIAQTQLKPVDVNQPFHYFPFDRCYLVPPELVDMVPQMFKIYMVMDLTRSLHAALQHVDFTRKYRHTIRRNYTGPEKLPKSGHITVVCPDPSGWKIVVPTYLHNVYDHETKGYTHSTIEYILSRIILNTHNKEASLPPITFHTPDRTFPLLCLACLRLPEQMANVCTPGTATCRNTRQFSLPVDPLVCEKKPFKKSKPRSKRS